MTDAIQTDVYATLIAIADRMLCVSSLATSVFLLKQELHQQMLRHRREQSMMRAHLASQTDANGVALERKVVEMPDSVSIVYEAPLNVDLEIALKQVHQSVSKSHPVHRSKTVNEAEDARRVNTCGW